MPWVTSSISPSKVSSGVTYVFFSIIVPVTSVIDKFVLFSAAHRPISQTCFETLEMTTLVKFCDCLIIAVVVLKCYDLLLKTGQLNRPSLELLPFFALGSRALPAAGLKPEGKAVSLYRNNHTLFLYKPYDSPIQKTCPLNCAEPSARRIIEKKRGMGTITSPPDRIPIRFKFE